VIRRGAGDAMDSRMGLGLVNNGDSDRRAKYAIGPDGGPLTIADLPPAGAHRWVPRRKAVVMAAVRGGLLSLEEASTRYALSVEEFRSWQTSVDKHGLAGLRTTRIQHYRQELSGRLPARRSLAAHSI